MALQPSNQDCADMFRTLVGDAMRMHPHYQELERRVLELADVIARPGKLKRDELRYYAGQLRALIKGFQ